MSHTNAGSLKRHKRSHTGERPFKCDVCKSGFFRSDHLTEHKKTHTGKRPFKCDLCKHEFTHSIGLKRHKRTHTGERPFKCDVCEKTFNQKHHLKVHKRSHAGERPFQCDACEKKFSQKSNLTKHKRSHTDEHPFTCEVCEKTFDQKHNLTEHKMIHTAERPFQCEVCMKSFNRAGSFKYHMKIHNNERSFKCTECGKSFIKKSHLNAHAFSHSSSPLFKCDACDASFFHKGSLKRHVCTHSEKQPYKANSKSRKISNKRCTTDRNPVQPGPDHNNEKSFKGSHCDASLTSTTTSNKHIKSKTHTTNSETEFTTPGDVSTITQLPSVSNQPSTSDIHINKSQNQEEYREYTETVALLNEFADTYPITPMDPGSCEHHDHDDLFLDQEMPEATFPDKQNADAGYLITQLHPVADWPLTSGIHVNKSQHQEKYEEIAEVLDYNHLQTIPPPKPSWDSDYSPGDYDDFLCP